MYHCRIGESRYGACADARRARASVDFVVFLPRLLSPAPLCGAFLLGVDVSRGDTLVGRKMPLPIFLERLARPLDLAAGRLSVRLKDAFSSSASQRIPVTAIRADYEFAKAFYTPTVPRPRLGVLRRLERRCGGRHFFHSRCADRNCTRTRSTSNRKPGREAEKEECVTLGR